MAPDLKISAEQPSESRIFRLKRRTGARMSHTGLIASRKSQNLSESLLRFALKHGLNSVTLGSPEASLSSDPLSLFQRDRLFNRLTWIFRRRMMNQIVPARFLFRWSFAAPRIDRLPHQSGQLLSLPEECLLPALDELEQQKPFAQVRLAWNDAGFGIALTVAGRTRRPECIVSELPYSDRIEVWIDTRNAQAAHRASRFCHHFAMLPLGGGPKNASPVVRALPIPRAREESRLPDAELVKVQSDVSETSYTLEAWFPAESLVGFDPQTYPRMGFHYMIHDGELGQQTIAGGAEFPYESDPSLWQTVTLIS